MSHNISLLFQEIERYHDLCQLQRVRPLTDLEKSDLKKYRQQLETQLSRAEKKNTSNRPEPKTPLPSTQLTALPPTQNTPLPHLRHLHSATQLSKNHHESSHNHDITPYPLLPPTPSRHSWHNHTSKQEYKEHDFLEKEPTYTPSQDKLLFVKRPHKSEHTQKQTVPPGWIDREILSRPIPQIQPQPTLQTPQLHASFFQDTTPSLFSGYQVRPQFSPTPEFESRETQNIPLVRTPVSEEDLLELPFHANHFIDKDHK